ncbi:MFS transporter [Saccharopolyspora sp. WRP15-2]|uniref:MFS transporter n=1 Tax=Saccharopolyspora oryzae TaxID=2997343 RepID=A0ABT4V782_9PSEU|nr:MFS transporter [Saccharopolyspora oryzae]MDA3629831.1 MFS transporter [Saccharopolyspora oryzae]
MSTGVQQAPTRPAGTAAVATMVLIVLVALALRPPFTAVAPLLEAIQRDLGVSNTFAGVLTTLPVVCLGVFAFVAPTLRQRFGDEKVVVGCLVVLLVGNSLRAAGSTWTLLAGTVVVGAGIAVANVALPGLIKRDFPHNIPVITAVYTVCLTRGGAFAASIVVPVGTALGSAWQAPLGVLAVPVLVALVISAFVLRRGSGAPPQPSRPGLLWRTPLAWQVTAFMGLQSAMAYVVFGWLPTMLQGRGMSAELSGLALGIQAAVQSIGSLAVPVLCRRFRDQRPISTVLAICIALGFAGILVGPASGVWPSVIVLGVAQGASFGLALTVIGLRAPDSDTAAALSGMAQGIGYLIAATGPLLIGLLHDLAGTWTAPLALLMACCAAWLISGLLACRHRQVPSVQHGGHVTTRP